MGEVTRGPFGAGGARERAAAPAGPPALEARGLGVTARAGRGERRPILEAIDLVAPSRRVLCLLGPSGVGKTTLLKCFNRLVDLEPGLETTGEILLGGEPILGSGTDVDRLRARVGMLFQQPVVFPGSIAENVLFGLGGAAAPRLDRRERCRRLERALEEVGLATEVAGRLDEPADRLSAGQRQRLCLARALVLEPEVLLMDEPTSALDPRAAGRIEELIRAIGRRRTVVLVTHDPAQAERVADLAVCLERCGGAGRVAGCTTCDNLAASPLLGRLYGGLPARAAE